MKKLRSEQGSILLAAFAILALLLIIMTALIAYGSWHKARCQLVLNRVKATYLAEAGIQHALAQVKDRISHWSNSETVAVDSSASFSCTTRPWGGYLLIESTGIVGKTEERLQATIGQVAPSIFSNTLSLIGPPYPLVIAGNSRIEGDVQVGPAGVSKGELHGQSYRGDSLVYGAVLTIQPQDVPQCSDVIVNEFLSNLDTIKKNCRERTDLSLIFRDPALMSDVDSRRTSASIVFDVSDTLPVQQPQYLFAEGSITVKGKSHLRNLVLTSASSITVNGDTHLEDCILVSPMITLTDRAEVSGQLFADSLITVDQDAWFADMALVYLIGHRLNDEWTGLISVASTRTSDACFVFHGNSRALDATQQLKQTGRIHIAPVSSVNGIVWTEGYLEAFGSFRGSAVANLLYHYESPTLYLNWLVDAWLESPEKAKRILPLMFGQDPVLEYKKIGPGA
jgi:hypothetical protein